MKRCEQSPLPFIRRILVDYALARFEDLFLPITFFL